MASGADPVIGVAQFLSVFVGASVATALAPHLVVLISGAAGGVLGLMSYRQCSAWEGLRYVLAMALLSWLLADSAAEIAASWWSALDDKRILSPVALSIGWVGHRWPSVGRWAGRLVKTAIEAAITKRAPW